MKFRLTQRGLTIAVVALTVVVVVIGISLAATSLPGFCASCKSHEPIVEAYHEGSHSDVNCELCHSKPGPFFFLTAKMEALEQPIAQVTGDYEEPILASVLNQSCRQCHVNDELFGVISAQGINVEHQHLIEAGFLCVRCHSTTGHPDAVPAGSRTYPSMDQCLMCHNNEFTSEDGAVAVADCELCHAKPGYDESRRHMPSPTGTRGTAPSASFRRAAPATTSLTAARTCHSGVEMPHPESWLSGARRARPTGSGSMRATSATTLRPTATPAIRSRCRTRRTSWCGTPARPSVSGRPASTATRSPNCQACHEAHVGGDPRAHDLFKAQEWTPEPTPSATPGTACR